MQGFMIDALWRLSCGKCKLEVLFFSLHFETLRKNVLTCCQIMGYSTNILKFF